MPGQETRTMEDPRWEPGMPVLDRQAVREPVLPLGAAPLGAAPLGAAPLGAAPRSLRGLPPRSVPEIAPTPLQRHYIGLSVIALICGAVAITAIEAGVPLGAPLIKLCVLVGAPLMVATTLDATVRIWRSAWAWMPVDRGRGLFRLTWVAATLTILAVAALFAVAVVLA